MAELRAKDQSNELGAEVLLVFPGSPQWGVDFFEKFWPGGKGISDLGGSLYRSFGLTRGSIGQLFGLSVFRRAFSAFRRGHRVGRPRGDTLLLPGAFLIEGQEIIWEHRAKNIADQPDLTGIPAKTA